MTRADRQDFLLCAVVVVAFVALSLVVWFLSAPQRPTISNDATYAQVVRNFSGRPYDTGQFVSGYSCAGYTAGRGGHGWVVIRCRK